MTTTKTTKKQITKAEVQRELARIRREMPDNTNPYNLDGYNGSKICLYHQGRGRNIRRCLIGQMGYDMGLPTPGPEAGAVIDVTYDGVWKGLFTEAAEKYMWSLQQQADGGDGEPIPWGQVKL